MKTFIAIVALATIVQGSYLSAVQTELPYPYTDGYYGVNAYNGLASYNLGHNAINGLGFGYDLSHTWPNALPYTTYKNDFYGYHGHQYTPTVLQTNVAKINSWGLHAGYGLGYNNYHAGTPVAKYVAANPGAVHVAPLPGHVVNQKSIVA